MSDHPTDWIKDAGWYTELRKTARNGADAEFDAMLARLLSEHARSAIEATADTGLRERVEALRDHAQTKAEATEPAQPWRWIGKRLTEALNATAAPTTDTGARDE